MKKVAIVIFIYVMITALGACGIQATSTATGLSETSTYKASVTETKTAGNNVWIKVGKVVTVEDIQYTVSGFKYSNGSADFAPEAGNSYCLIDISVKNNTKKEAPISSMLMFDLTDADGKSYDISLGGLVSLEGEKLAQLDGNVAASSEMRGGLAYEVPQNAKGITLAIKEILGDGELKVKLN